MIEDLKLVIKSNMYKFWNDYEYLLWILGYDLILIDDYE